MGNSAVDYGALGLALLLAATISTSLVVAYRTESMRRLWIAGGVLTLALVAIGVMDLTQSPPRETHFATVIGGAILPVLGGVGATWAARRTRWWLRWLLVFVTALVLLFAGLLLGATMAARLL